MPERVRPLHPEKPTPAVQYAQEVLDLRARTRKPGESQMSVRTAIGRVLDSHHIRDAERRTELFREIGATVERESRLKRWKTDAAGLQAKEEARAGQTYEESGLEGAA